jgi:hypothetical protein
MPIRRPCLDCRQLTTEPTRCPTCNGKRESLRNASRPHYKGDYPARSQLIRDTATHCWICGEGPKPGDPWTADHVYGPGDPTLAAAHRSCNIRRGVASRR